MKTEKSCGAVVFTKEQGIIQFVVIRSNEGMYGFPKGHMEGSESEAETALREILEETGLSVTFIPGFRVENTYTYIRNDEKILKQVVYFLGEYSNQLPVAQETELAGIHLMDYDHAMNVLQFENLKELLTQANSYLCR